MLQGRSSGRPQGQEEGKYGGPHGGGVCVLLHEAAQRGAFAATFTPVTFLR